MMKRLIAKWLGIAPEIRLVPVEDPVRELDESEMHAAFSRPADDPLWLAVNQLLREQVVQARLQTCSPHLADRPGTLTHCAGGMEWLSVFQADLHARWRKANGGADPAAVPPRKMAPVAQKPAPVKPAKAADPTDEELLAGE